MNINELDTYNLADAVKFHRRLNPRIWGRDEQLLPEVRDKLLAIAADFQEFLGVEDLDIRDITISGSNAAYSYTKNSDIDLHLIVAMPDNPVYQELFNAKKYQYNDEHNIKIGGADVELYVQPADQTHISQGVYSIRDNKWISIPQRKRAQVDDACVRDKVASLDARIHSAVRSKNLEAVTRLWDKIKAMRKIGLEQHGEFGCENIAFKLLRNNGCIKLLKDTKTALEDRELSLREAEPRQRFRYGFSEGMQSQPYSTSDGVAASTKQFLEDSTDDNIVQDFIQHVTTELGIDPVPEIHLHTDPAWSEQNQSFGRYDPESHTLNVSMPNRHVMDVLRTVAHELVHCSQNQQHGQLPDDAGETGSRWENDANARAGVIMRDWANSHPEHFAHDALEESASGYIPKNKKEAKMPQYAMALSVDIKPGQVGKEANKLGLKTGRNGEPGLLQPDAENLLREFSEFVTEQDNLFEITMSPTSLKKLSAQTGALAGMEFEMIVPGAGDDDDGDQEPDYDFDQRCRSIQDARDFFYDGDFNSRRDIERMSDRMQDDYAEWLYERLDTDFTNESEYLISEWVANNVDESEWNPDDLEGEARQEALDEFIANVDADPSSDYYQQAWAEYREENQDSYDESDWLDAEDLDLMSGVENVYNITWPHWRSTGSGEVSVEDTADSFQAAVGRDVKASSSYHSGRVERPSTRSLHYIVEPDASLDPDDSDDQGLEFVSPPLPIEELLSDLNKVKAWADKTGCYTNDSTGLHINVSVPGWTQGTDQLDYVKLALLLGDEFVLDSFGRASNTYTKSAMGKIVDIVRQRPDRAQLLMNRMKKGLDQLATRLVHSRQTEKYTSINIKNGYIEFRSPGGDWLNDKFPEIENTLRRFTVALSAAVDPDAYRQEYLKKLYKLLDVSGEKDPLSYFAKYAAGELPKAALKSFVRQAQLERGIKRGKEQPQDDVTPFEIYNRLNDAVVSTVLARNAQEAMAELEQFRQEQVQAQGITVAQATATYGIRHATGEPATPQQPQGVDTRVDYELYSRASGAVIDTFPARNDDEAQIRLDDYRQHGAGQSNPDNFGVRRAASGSAGASTTASHPEGRGRPNNPTGRYGIVARSDQAAYGRTGGPPPAYQFRFDMANLEDQGHGRYVLQAWAARNLVNPADYIVVDTTQYADAAQGGTIDVATDQPAQQPAGMGQWNGQWRVLVNGREVYRFGNIGNSQADANRIAAAWLRQNGQGVSGEGFEVYPVMAEARKNPEQNTKYQSGWAELAAWAHKNNVWLKPHEWAISMTYVPKLGINPGPGISEDTPRGIYFYPFHWAYSVKMDKEALPWADNAPYIQLFQYSTGTELYDPNQIPLASAVAQLKNYGITDEDIAAEKENYPSISTYNLLVWCLGRKYDDNKRVSILNKVLRNLGYDYMIDNGKGWIAINEPTQGVVLNPKIIDKVVTFNNYTRKKEQDVAEGKITLSTDPNWYGATVDNYQASGPVVNIPANQLVGFEPDDKMNQPKSKVNVEKIVAGLKQGAKLPPLLVRKYKNGYQVLDGHHRFWAYKLLSVKSIPAQIVPDSDIEEISKQGVAENFADGKNPGRKGLAKRSGVNTKASVSDLRKTAKNSSGEKQRMAHWLANMKAGRAKAKRK
jgi:hypothetical protein